MRNNIVIIFALLAVGNSCFGATDVSNGGGNERNASAGPVGLIAGKERLTLYPNGTLTNGKDQVKLEEANKHYSLGNRKITRVVTASGDNIYIGKDIVKADGNYHVIFHEYSMSPNGNWEKIVQPRAHAQKLKTVGKCLFSWIWCIVLAFTPGSIP